MLEYKQIVAGYGTPVIGPVSLRIGAGEIVGLSGSNGIGKSTLFRALSGEARIFAGSIVRASGLTIAHHRQEPIRPLENPLTGRDLLALTLADPNNAPQRLLPFLDQRLDELSGGQLQLMEIASLLGGPAQLLLLDEPTRHLDRDAHELLANLLGIAAAQRRAVMIVSHEPAFLDRVCTRQIVLNGAAPDGNPMAATA